jgi:hypothetical protein
MLSSDQREWLADFERMQNDREYGLLWAMKWSRRSEVRAWMADPEFQSAYLKVREKHGLSIST